MLHARGLTHHMGERVLFEGLDLSVPTGETVCVVGPSGCGKSQLLRVLSWLTRPTSGSLSLSGRDPLAWGVPEWRRRVALVPQEGPVLSGTAQEWLERIGGLGVHAARESEHRSQAIEAAAALGLDGSAWSQTWATLSGGERQRLHLALALAGEPDVLLLDEPTSALDADVAGRLEAMCADRTAVWVTHDRQQADRIASQIVVIGGSP